MSNQNSFDSSMPQQNDSRLVDLREWYNEKSKEFGSANYQKYKENRNAFLKDSEEYAEYERRLELENESFKQGFADKLKLSLGNYQTKIQRAGNPQWTPIPKAITIESNSETYYCAPAELLKPEDLLAFEESGIDDDISSNSSSEVGTISEYVEADHRLEGEVTTLSSESSALFTVNDNRSDQVTAESTHIQKKSESHEKKPDLYPIFNSASNFFKWLQYYSSFLSELQREVQIFEQDQTKKELRMYISRTLATRINDCAKRNCSTSEIAALSNFLVDLFDGKTIENWRGEKFHLEIEDEKQLFYAMVTICDRYLEQIKWDLELMEQIRLVLVMICLKQPIFYKIFCAKVVDSLTLLSFDMDKIISKINSFGKETSQEAASHWINDEQAIFRLFCKVQLAIKSTDEKMAHGIKGPSLLKMIFVETIKSIKPTPLCSAFVLLEITENFKKLLGPQNPEFGVKLTSCYIPQIKESGILDVSSEHLPRRVGEKLDDSAKRIFTSRQDYLCCLLNAALTDLEKKLFTIRK